MSLNASPKDEFECSNVTTTLASIFRTFFTRLVQPHTQRTFPKRLYQAYTQRTSFTRPDQLYTQRTSRLLYFIPALFLNSATGITIILPIGLLFRYVINFMADASFGTVKGARYFG